MNVLFIARATLYTDKGGDTVQVLNTAEHLRALGISVDVKLTHDTFSYEAYDLLHFFNIIRPADILHHVANAHKPFVVSTIYVDYSEFEKKNRTGLPGFIFRHLDRDLIEYLKVIARFAKNGEKIMSGAYLFLGHRRALRRVIRKSALLLPNSKSEYQRLSADYGMEHPYKVIPNAIDPDLFIQHAQPPVRDEKLVLCVGRIEGRKNQLNLVRALANTEFRLIIIGSVSPNQAAYFDACKQAATPNVTFVNSITQTELKDYYQRAKVHVLASWFETTGLSSLEAAVMGCNVVITEKGDAREYFQEYAYYCAPDKPESILSAVITASSQPYNVALFDKIVNHYTWKQTAEKTLEAYKQIIGY